MDILIKILQFVLCFTLIVGLHEFGHYIAARIFGIRVEKFYIFFDWGFSLFKINYKGTEYGIGWLPLGGYVKIGGMIDESMDKEQMAQPIQPDDFRAKPAWQRFIVMIAGVVMNVLTAIAIYCAISFTYGESYFSNEDTHWGYNFNEAGHRLGFRDGDRIRSIDGERIDNYLTIVNSLLLVDGDRTVQIDRNGEAVELTLPFKELIEMRRDEGYKGFLAVRAPFIVDSIASPTAALLQRGDEVIGAGEVRSGMDQAAIKAALTAAAGRSIDLHVVRTTDTLTVNLPVSAEGTLGVMITNPLQLRTRTYTLLESIPAGLRRTGTMISDYWDQLKLIVNPQTKMYEELGGFIAIGSIFSPELNWLDFWMKTAFLSIILAVMNILPIPGLDGGHAIFTCWEMLTGRKVSDRVLEIAQYIGLGILLVLLVYANGNDIFRFFIK